MHIGWTLIFSAFLSLKPEVHVKRIQVIHPMVAFSVSNPIRQRKMKVKPQDAGQGHQDLFYCRDYPPLWQRPLPWSLTVCLFLIFSRSILPFRPLCKMYRIILLQRENDGF
jgi:hypothetical protein